MQVLIVGIIAFNESVGPVVFRRGLDRAGEIIVPDTKALRRRDTRLLHLRSLELPTDRQLPRSPKGRAMVGAIELGALRTGAEGWGGIGGEDRVDLRTS